MFSSFTLELCIKQQEKKSYATGREAYSWPSLQLTEHRVNFVTWLRRRWRRRKKISRNIFLKKDPVKNLVNDFVREIKNRVCFVKQNYQFRYPDSLAFHLLARSTSWWKKISAESRTKAKTLRLFLSLFISRMDEKLHLIYGLFLLLLPYLFTRLEFLMWNSIRLWINLFLSYVTFFGINRAYNAIYLQKHAVL